MIENPTRKDLVDLIAKESGTCVSILMRTHEKGRETKQNPIRFKNLVSDAIRQVGVRDGKADDKVLVRLRELANLEHDSTLWQHQSEGFAMFVTADFDQHFKLSHRPEEKVYVGEAFYTLPIASASCGGGSARILALSWERARLFVCDGHSVTEIDDDSFPVKMDDLVTERDPEVQLQFTSHPVKGGGSSGAGNRSIAMYHGQGEGEDKIKADRDLYLTRVGRMVAEEIYNTDHPLILLATKEVAGHFTSTTDLKVVEVVHASPDGLEDQELRRQILETAQSFLRKSGDDLTEKLGTAIANETGSNDLKEIVSQAANGRVDTLLLGKVTPQYGHFDRESRKVDIDDDSETDLVNLAVRETLQTGGSVAKMNDVDSKHCVGAIYRY